MSLQRKDALGVIEAAANLPAGGWDAAGNLLAGCWSAVGTLLACSRLPGGFSLWFHCASTHVSPAILHLGAWPMPGLAPGLTETVSQSYLALVKYLSDSHLTEIIGRPGSFCQVSMSGLRRSQIGRFWRSS
ncbi:unnamed protein product [marine sediment metagenome]|uniref:Uncharacterized protein n=1 Tax=marine sediment metagenome TaxID=412755 RepID=X1KR79_9ZZZZ